MRIDRVQRRLFLTGAGVALAAPFLPSLLPRSLRAQTPTRPVRYVQILNPYGPTTRQFYGSLTASDAVEEFVGSRRLSDIDGDISPMLGPAFTRLKHKISLIHGMDVIARNANHNMCFATCASSYASGLDGDGHPPVSGQPSVDVLMSKSAAVYPEDTPTARRLLVLNPVETDGYTDTRSFSWQANAAGEIEMVRPTKTTLGLTDLLVAGFDGSEQPRDDAADQAVLNAVYADFQRVEQHSRLGSADRERLLAYMDLLQDAVRAEPTQGTDACELPQFADEVDVDRTVQNQFRLLTAAMLCNVTRVASITLGASEGYDVRHAEHHDDIANTDDVGLFEDFVRFGRWVGELAETFEAMPDGEGSLLDSSILYWSAQYGNARPFGDAHRTANMPVMVAGSAGGQLNTGYYLDYRKDGQLEDDEARGIPINNLLITFMNCMGLGSADYEPPGRAGYGDYTDEFFDNPLRPQPDRWATTEGRRSPLPFFYQGPSRG